MVINNIKKNIYSISLGQIQSNTNNYHNTQAYSMLQGCKCLDLARVSGSISGLAMGTRSGLSVALGTTLPPQLIAVISWCSTLCHPYLYCQYGDR